MYLFKIQSSVGLGLTLGLLTAAWLPAAAQVRSVDEVAPEPALVTKAEALIAETQSPVIVPLDEASRLADVGDVGAAELTEASSAEEALIAQQTDQETPERINYSFGVGGTVGLSDGGDTALGDGGFSFVGRFSITDNLSVHTASVIGDNSLFTAAVTGGAPIVNKEANRTLVFPFAGAGVSVETEDFDINPFISAGVDIPIIDKLTGTVRINTSFDEDGTDVGLVFGVGYDLFSLF